MKNQIEAQKFQSCMSGQKYQRAAAAAPGIVATLSKLTNI